MSGRIGSSASPVAGVPALDIAKVLKDLAERTRVKDKIRSALDSLEIGDTTIVRLETQLVPKTFSADVRGEGTFTFTVSMEGVVRITKTR